MADMKHVEEEGESLNVTKEEMAVFIGINFVMSVCKMPSIMMYWDCLTRFSLIAEKIIRDRFFKLRSFLKVVNDDLITPEHRKEDKLWKVRNILNEVRARCLELPRPNKVSIDENMIPFRGKVNVK